jgi:hypothetical protein
VTIGLRAMRLPFMGRLHGRLVTTDSSGRTMRGDLVPNAVPAYLLTVTPRARSGQIIRRVPAAPEVAPRRHRRRHRHGDLERWRSPGRSSERSDHRSALRARGRWRPCREPGEIPKPVLFSARRDPYFRRRNIVPGAAVGISVQARRGENQLPLEGSVSGLAAWVPTGSRGCLNGTEFSTVAGVMARCGQRGPRHSLGGLLNGRLNGVGDCPAAEVGRHVVRVRSGPFSHDALQLV